MVVKDIEIQLSLEIYYSTNLHLGEVFLLNPNGAVLFEVWVDVLNVLYSVLMLLSLY